MTSIDLDRHYLKVDSPTDPEMLCGQDLAKLRAQAAILNTPGMPTPTLQTVLNERGFFDYMIFQSSCLKMDALLAGSLRVMIATVRNTHWTMYGDAVAHDNSSIRLKPVHGGYGPANRFLNAQRDMPPDRIRLIYVQIHGVGMTQTFTCVLLN